jgi:DNA-directed RNA polymerase specialized sigma24 family protein
MCTATRFTTKPANLALPDLHSPTGIELARIDAAKILTLCRPRDRNLFEQQMRGLTTDEIATQEGVSTTVIRIRLLRARRAARANLEGRALRNRQEQVPA